MRYWKPSRQGQELPCRSGQCRDPALLVTALRHRPAGSHLWHLPPPCQLNGSIKVYNDGAGVPVEVHKEHGVHVPELIFGHLLTSSNYDDKEKKVRSKCSGTLLSICGSPGMQRK